MAIVKQLIDRDEKLVSRITGNTATKNYTKFIAIVSTVK